MKRLCLISVFLFFIVFLVFGEKEEFEEIDYLLFLPNSSTMFVNEERAMVQLDNMAKYLASRDIAPGQINVYGYAAFAVNDIDPVDLSTNRALFVIDQLQRRGIPQNLFSDPVGHGSVDLWGDNVNEENKSPNRRVRVVLDGNVIVMEQSTGQVKESEITPAAEEVKEKPITREDTGVPRKKFPWWILIPLLLVLFIPFIFSKNKRRPVKRPTEPKKVEQPPAAPAAPKERTVPPAAAPSKKSEPPVVFAAASKKPAKTETSESVVYLEEEIRRRAYDHHLLRNGENGSMDGDWYKALTEVRAKYEAAGYKTYSDGCWWARKTFVRTV